MAVAPPDEAGAISPRLETIEELFNALESPLLSYALRLLPETTMAEEVVQEAFVRLHTQREQVREARNWLYRTVHNLALNQRRRAGKIVPLNASTADNPHAKPAADPPDPQPLPDGQIARREGIGLVRLGFENLDARSRELLQLKFQNDLSYQEISGRTGLSVGNVGSLLHHSLKSLAAELAKAGLVA